MLDPRTETQTQINIRLDVALVIRIEAAAHALGKDKSRFIRDAIGEDLVRRGYMTRDEFNALTAAPSRKGKGGRPTHQDFALNDATAAILRRPDAPIEIDERQIMDAIKKCKGNRTQAAKMLSISVRTLRNKLNEYNLRDSSDSDSEDAVA